MTLAADNLGALMYYKTCRSCLVQAMGNSLFHGVNGEKVRVKSIKKHVATAAHKSAENVLQPGAHPERGALVSTF